MTLFRALCILILTTLSGTVHAMIDDATIEHIETEIDNGRLVGVMVAVLGEDGVHFQGFGLAREGDTAPDENTVFEIGSVTKTFTATLLAHMVEAGQVALDDPVQDYLPPGITLAQTGERPITLQDLAAHRSGLPRMPPDFTSEDPLNPYAGISVEDLWETVDTVEPTAAPGERVEYSNLGYALLGQALARRAGLSYAALVRQTVLGPLDMQSSDLSLTDTLRPRAATGYGQGGEPTPYWELSGGYAPAGAINSTAADMLRYLRANLGQLGSEELQRAMAMTHTPRESLTGNLRVGLGWITMPAGSGHWHNGGTYGFHTFVGFSRESGRAVVLWANSFAADDGLDAVGMHLLNPDIPLPAARPPRVERSAISMTTEQLGTYEGDYRMDFGATLSVFLEDGQLMAQLTGQPAVPVFPEGRDRFFYRVVDAQIEFLRNDQGEATGLILYQGGQQMEGEKE